MEKNENKAGRTPKYDVWVYDLGDQRHLEMMARSGEIQKAIMRRFDREQHPSMLWAVDVELVVLEVGTRRKRKVGSTHQETIVKVRMAKDAPKGILNSLDDGRGLLDFKKGTEFEIVVWSDDTGAARVSRSSEVLYAGEDCHE